MPLSLHPAAVTLVLKKLSLSGEKFICHFSTNTGSILSLLLRKEPDIYTSIIGAHYRQETEPDLGFFPDGTNRFLCLQSSNFEAPTACCVWYFSS